MSEPSRPSSKRTLKPTRGLTKAPTGILGLDEVTGGGLPRGRPTLVLAAPGAARRCFGLEFLVHGASTIRRARRLRHVRRARGRSGRQRTLPRLRPRGPHSTQACSRSSTSASSASEIEETGEYDLEALFIRLDHALRSIRPRASSSTRSSRCLPDSAMPASCAPSCGGCSPGSRTAASRPSSPASAA